MLPSSEEYVSRAELQARLSQAGVAEAGLIEGLIRGGVLVERDTPADRSDRAVDAGWRWRHDARWFHFSSSDVQYEPDRARQEEMLAPLGDAPPPPPQKPPSGALTALPGTFDEPRGELWEVLRRRRTRRTFLPQPLDVDLLGRLMLWTWGATDERHHAVLGGYFLKTSPSGGARHPTDVYVLAHRVTGLAPRVYRYAPREHALEPLDVPVDGDVLQAVFAGHDWFRTAPVGFVMTSVMERNAWKYRHSHAYRVLLLDAGHLGQTFHLVCTALGLAPFTSAAIDDSLTSTLLDLDPALEIVVYGAATGWPAPQAQ